MKFIPTLPYTTDSITQSLQHLQWDNYLKIIFAGNNNPNYKHQTSKLYMKSTWNPSLADIPPTIIDRLDQFSTQVKKLFQKKKLEF